MRFTTFQGEKSIGALLTRVYGDLSEDRRAKAIVLTPRGRATAEQVEMVARKIRNDALAGLSDQEIEIAHRVLDHVCGFLNAAVEEPPA